MSKLMKINVVYTAFISMHILPQNPPLHFASFGPDGLLVTASVEGHVVKVWPPMGSPTDIAVQPQARLAVGVSKETADPGFIHRSAAGVCVGGLLCRV